MKRAKNEKGYYKIKSKLRKDREGRFAEALNTLEYFWAVHIKTTFFFFLSWFSTVFTIVVVFGEFIILFDSTFKIFSYDFRDSYIGGIVFLTSVILTMIYVTQCTFFGLFEMKFATSYSIYFNRLTDPYSLIYSAYFMCYLASPLCLNFTLLFSI